MLLMACQIDHQRRSARSSMGSIGLSLSSRWQSADKASILSSHTFRATRSCQWEGVKLEPPQWLLHTLVTKITLQQCAEVCRLDQSSNKTIIQLAQKSPCLRWTSSSKSNLVLASITLMDLQQRHANRLKQCKLCQHSKKSDKSLLFF